MLAVEHITRFHLQVASGESLGYRVRELEGGTSAIHRLAHTPRIPVGILQVSSLMQQDIHNVKCSKQSLLPSSELLLMSWQPSQIMACYFVITCTSTYLSAFHNSY